MNNTIRNVLLYVLYLIVVWSVYRISGVVMPQEIDEFLIKPLVWLLPIFFLVRWEKKSFSSVGITSKNLVPGIYLAIFLGILFTVEAFFVNFLKYGNFTHGLDASRKPFLYFVLISLGTAVVEEIAFRGYIFTRLWNYFKNEVLANVLTSVFWVVIHVPATLILLGYSLNDGMSYWLLTLLYSVGACFIFARTRNIFPTILLYVLWEAPIILFR